jgi:hypothetical protein
MLGKKTAIYTAPLNYHKATKDVQIEVCNDLAVKRGWNSVQIYSDENDSKENLNKLINEINLFDRIIIFSYPCLSNIATYKIIKVLEKMRDINGDLVIFSIMEYDYDPPSLQNFLLNLHNYNFAILFSFSHNERILSCEKIIKESILSKIIKNRIE